MTVRVRFAPSPTGLLHVGNARTAILNWLCARHYKGVFILRIEDTDVERSTPESELGIIHQLQWLGLDWDEGPGVGGTFGPYRQSERLHLYQEEAKNLLHSGAAYYCFCTKEELEAEREQALKEKRPPGYSGKCRNLTKTEQEQLRAQGRIPVVRFRVPEKPVIVKDLVQGEITFEGENITDFVIQRESGTSPYNFAAVVDDALMQITHVIRGSDHISNTPKQIVLFNALGYKTPEFAHIPMILGMDGVRLSKRHGHTSVEEYKNAGYLPEALINYLSLLSWSSETGDEILSIDRLIKEFDFKRILKSPARFDTVKLNWLNGIYIRALSPEKQAELAKPYLDDAGFIENDPLRFSKIVGSVRDNVETLADYPKHAQIFFKDIVEISGNEEKEIIKRESSQTIFRKLIQSIESTPVMNLESFQNIMKTIQKETGIKGKDLWMPVRIALTGQMHGPELIKILEILGRERCIKLLSAVVLK